MYMAKKPIGKGLSSCWRKLLLQVTSGLLTLEDIINTKVLGHQLIGGGTGGAGGARAPPKVEKFAIRLHINYA